MVPLTPVRLNGCAVLNSPSKVLRITIPFMTHLALHKFIRNNRKEVIRRCRAKVATRSAPLPTEAEIDHGVPLFLDQLCEELRHGPSQTLEISKGAIQHGHDLQLRGFTVGQVVHDYGDICQSVSDLAWEMAAPISTDEFRTLNRCLDDAIAGAVTEYARGHEVTREDESNQLRTLTKTAITAFEVIQTGTVGLEGTTAAVLHRSLKAIWALVDRSPA
jgi:hypothetical protein